MSSSKQKRAGKNIIWRQNGGSSKLMHFLWDTRYQTNQMTQCRDISQKPDFGPNLGLNGPILGRNIFECYDLHYQLDIIAV